MIVGDKRTAARKRRLGDLIIIVTYAQYDESELKDFAPKIVFCDGKNGIRKLIEK